MASRSPPPTLLILDAAAAKSFYNIEIIFVSLYIIKRFAAAAATAVSRIEGGGAVGEEGRGPGGRIILSPPNAGLF